MNPSNADQSFAGSIPQCYERYLVPLIFEPYAKEMAARVATLHHGQSSNIEAQHLRRRLRNQFIRIRHHQMSLAQRIKNQECLPPHHRPIMPPNPLRQHSNFGVRGNRRR